MRLDLFLVSKSYYKSREQAKEAIVNELVYVNDKLALKPSMEINGDEKIVALDNFKYVSRGGLKLEKAIEEFYLDFQEKTIVDIGSSTGGFTDCSLKHGAKKVYSIDVGTDQLDESLKYDERVISLEQTNFLDIPYFNEEIDYYVMDVSFVSITQIIPHIITLGGENIIALIKPQYEVGPKLLNKNGVLKDRAMHLNVLKAIDAFVNNLNYRIHKITFSPIKGKSGNIEYICHIKKSSNSNIDFYQVVNNAFNKVK